MTIVGNNVTDLLILLLGTYVYTVLLQLMVIRSKKAHQWELCLNLETPVLIRAVDKNTHEV